ncbi:unnamed protein product, partial [Ectocarpus fasciculatus]
QRVRELRHGRVWSGLQQYHVLCHQTNGDPRCNLTSKYCVVRYRDASTGQASASRLHRLACLLNRNHNEMEYMSYSSAPCHNSRTQILPFVFSFLLLACLSALITYM